MKKILIILILFISTGCSDYQELDSLSYVTGLAVDYIDNSYIVTFEVMENEVTSDGVDALTYISVGSSTSLYEAFVNASTKLNKTAYFLHTQVIILSTNVIREQLYDVVDTIIRNPKLNEEFLLVVTSDNPTDILSLQTEVNKSASFYIYGLIKDNEYATNYYLETPFAVFTDTLMNDNIDPILSLISIEDDEIIINGSLAFSNYDITQSMTLSETNLYNAMNDDTAFIPLTIYIDDDTVDISLKISECDIDVSSNNIVINLVAESEIKKSDENIDLEIDKTYALIDEAINTELEKQVTNLVEVLQNSNSDIFGFSKIFYMNQRISNNDLWTNAQVEVNVSSYVSRKGIVFNVS